MKIELRSRQLEIVVSKISSRIDRILFFFLSSILNKLKIFRCLFRDKKEGASYYPREEARQKRKSISGSVCGARKCCLSAENAPSCLQVRIVSKENRNSLCYTLLPGHRIYIYREREGLIMRNTYSQTQSCDTRNAGGIRGFLQADN